MAIRRNKSAAATAPTETPSKQGLTIQVDPNQIFNLPEGQFRFVMELEDAKLLLQNDARKQITLTQKDLVKLISDGQATKRTLHRDRKGRPQCIPDDELGPDERDTPRGVRARTIQLYVRAFDAFPGAAFSKRQAARVINHTFEDAQRLGLTHPMSATQLLNYVQTRGAPGDRKVGYFLDQRGRHGTSRLGEAMEELIREHAVYYYWETPGAAYQDAIDEFNTRLGEANLIRRADGLNDLEAPSDDTIIRRIHAARNQENYATKHSDYEAHATFEGVTDHLKATRFGELVILDHTVMDAFLLLDHESGLPLGRPYLTVAIDVFSRCVMGFLITAEPPSIYTITMILKRINRDKSFLAEAYPDVEGGTDAYGHVDTLMVDNGWDINSASTIDSLRDLGTNVHFTPIANGPAKAIGERLFRTIKNGVFDKVRGGVKYNVSDGRRARKRPQNEAAITLWEMERLVYMFQIVYENRRHRGIKGIPALILKKHLARHPRRMIDDIKTLDVLVGAADVGTLSRAGVNFKKMHFHDREGTTAILNDMVGMQPRSSQSKKTFESARVAVKIKYNPADCSKIQVWNEARRHYVTLVNRDERFTAGLSFWAAERCFEYAEKEELEFKTDAQRLQIRNQLRKAWEVYVKRGTRQEAKQAIRGMALEKPTLEGTTVKVAAAPATTNGMAKVEPEATVSVATREKTRIDGNRRPKGLARNAPKQKRTRAETSRHKASIAQKHPPTTPPASVDDALVIPKGATARAPRSDNTGWGVSSPRNLNSQQ